MPKTQHDILCAGLEALGGERQPKRNKYTVYRAEAITPLVGAGTIPLYYFVGKSGALRYCSRPNAAASVVCGDRTRQRIIDAQTPDALLEQVGL